MVTFSRTGDLFVIFFSHTEANCDNRTLCATKIKRLEIF
jgi:hypothetical protein